MVARYPGAEKRYRKHVLNRNQDGRYTTTLYYLNKDFARTLNGIIFLPSLYFYPYYISILMVERNMLISNQF